MAKGMKSALLCVAALVGGAAAQCTSDDANYDFAYAPLSGFKFYWRCDDLRYESRKGGESARVPYPTLRNFRILFFQTTSAPPPPPIVRARVAAAASTGTTSMPR